MKNRGLGQKGFSLVEVMIAVAISSVLMYTLFVVMRTSNEQMQSAEVKMTIQDSARESLYKMIQEIRLSAPSRVTIGMGGTSIQFYIPDASAPLNADYTVDWNVADLVTYTLGGTNNRQILRTSNGQTTVMANDVSSVSFTGDATPPNVVTVTVNFQRQMVNTRQMTATPMQLTAKAELRNS
jgi:prepilin-type N-terminal cleavage/methylation domain-containing protein